MHTLLADFAATQPTDATGFRKVTDISATDFYWAVAIGSLVAVVLGWLVIKYAVRSALRAQANDKRPTP